MVLLTTFIPLVVCLYFVTRSSYRHTMEHARHSQLQITQNNSSNLSNHLTNQLNQKIDLLVTSSNIKAPAFRNRQFQQSKHSTDITEGRKNTEHIWDEISDIKDERLKWLYWGLANQKFRINQDTDNSLLMFALVDTDGLLIGSSYKPLQFNQKNEEWWQLIASQTVDKRVMRPVIIDEKPCYELLVTLSRPKASQEAPVAFAYMRLVVDRDALFRQFADSFASANFDGSITDMDGTIIYSKGDLSLPVDLEKAPSILFSELQSSPDMILNNFSFHGHEQDPYLVTAADLKLDQCHWLVICSENQNNLMGGLKRDHLLQVMTVIGLVAFFTVIGYFYLRSTVSTPINNLRKVSESVADASKQGLYFSHTEVKEIVAPLEKIHTKDEIQQLARHFSSMAKDVLNFQAILEAEVVSKTQQINEDLEMAREFQQALLPHDYEWMRDMQQVGSSYRLDLAHFYQPAAAVGGDFFDVFPIGEDRVGVFIADVMGHGARSALVTAILRALVRPLTMAEDDPASFLAELNDQFSDIIVRSGQVIFVTAAYLVFDLNTGLVRGSHAGHPHMIIYRRSEEKINRLLGDDKGSLPLGLTIGVDYTTREWRMQADDVFVLFTDGAIEPENMLQEPLGVKGLKQIIKRRFDKDNEYMVKGIAYDIMRYANQMPEDDICILSVAVHTVSQSAAAERLSTASQI